jgi:predicted Rossmann fold flavoprotein
VTNNAKDIVHVFTSICNDTGQEIICDADVKSVTKQGDIFTVKFDYKGAEKIIRAKKIVIASGGLPIPKMGASDFALNIARQFGHKITKTAPALVPLVINHHDREWYEQLSGTSVFSRVSNDRISFEENILFTHWGLSGPAILQISSYWKAGESIEIDFLPQQNIIELLESERQVNGKKLLGNFLSNYIPKRLSEALGKYIPAEKNLASLSRDELTTTEKYIHHFTLKPAGDKGYEKAEVMRGGIDTDELSSKTLESKKVPGLFFGGECVDVTGWLGGYNFQWAWASGYVIANSL